LIAANDGSPRARMTIACRALWMALEARQPSLSEAAFRKEVSTYLDDALRLGVALDVEIDGLRPPNPYKARFAELGPIIEQLGEELDAVMLDPDASLSDMRKVIDKVSSDPAMREAEELSQRLRRPAN